MRKSLALIAVFVLVAVTGLSQVQNAKRFSDWKPIIHLPPPINSEFDDHAAILSKDEKTIYFTSNRTGSVEGSEDIWFSTRRDRSHPWQTPVRLGPAINTSAMERVRSFSDDGRILLFQSDRPGSLGFTDIWAVVRNDTKDNYGWGEPVNLGPMINSPSTELAANYLIADSGLYRKLFFSSNKPGGLGGPDIYQSTIGGLGFEIPVNVFELNSPSIETCFWVRDDGLEILFSSNRPNIAGDIQQHNIWAAYRESVYEMWSPPEMLGGNVNVPDWQDVNPALSFDNKTILMASRRPGGIGPGTFDIYITRRSLLSEGR